MTDNLMVELVAAHADELNRGGAAEMDAVLDAFPAERRELGSLFRLAERVQRALAPVKFAPAARARLRQGLMMAAEHQHSEKILIGRRESVWGWVIGAAALGSAAGLIALALRARQPRGRVAELVAESRN